MFHFYWSQVYSLIIAHSHSAIRCYCVQLLYVQINLNFRISWSETLTPVVLFALFLPPRAVRLHCNVMIGRFFFFVSSRIPRRYILFHLTLPLFLIFVNYLVFTAFAYRFLLADAFNVFNVFSSGRWESFILLLIISPCNYIRTTTYMHN